MKIVGIPSGDHECWCLLVTKEDFKAIMNEDPGEFDEGPFAEAGSDYRYKIYPDNIMVPPCGILDTRHSTRHKLLEINIEVKEILPPKL